MLTAPGLALLVAASGGQATAGRTERVAPNDNRIAAGTLTDDVLTLRLIVGRTYRLRLIDIIADWTAKIALLREDSVVHWRALAKDGAELPAPAQVVRSAAFIAGPGETMDFEYRPTAPGPLHLEVQQRTGLWKTRLPIRVER